MNYTKSSISNYITNLLIKTLANLDKEVVEVEERFITPPTTLTKMMS